MGLEPTTTGITIRGSTNWATVTINKMVHAIHDVTSQSGFSTGLAIHWLGVRRAKDTLSVFCYLRLTQLSYSHHIKSVTS